jgi:hypothetical protein
MRWFRSLPVTPNLETGAQTGISKSYPETLGVNPMVTLMKSELLIFTLMVLIVRRVARAWIQTFVTQNSN